jgi:archaeoflavoprotein AfpA
MSLKKRFAWGITGSGDDINKIFDIMVSLKQRYSDVEIRVFISKSGEQVLKWYKLLEKIKKSFKRVQIESSPNTPFLAGELQSGKYDFLIIAPTTSNSTAKIAVGIGDTMITNSVNMATKAGIPVYVLPCEIGEDETITVLPNGKEFKLKIREIDARHINEIKKMEEIHVLHSLEDINRTVENFYL